MFQWAAVATPRFGRPSPIAPMDETELAWGAKGPIGLITVSEKSKTNGSVLGEFLELVVGKGDGWKGVEKLDVVNAPSLSNKLREGKRLGAVEFGCFCC